MKYIWLMMNRQHVLSLISLRVDINDTIKHYCILSNATKVSWFPAVHEAHIWRSESAVSCLLLQLRYQTFQRAAGISRRRPCVDALKLDSFVFSEFITMQLTVVQLLWDGEDFNRRWVRWFGSGDRRVSEQHTESYYGSCLWVLSELTFAHLYTFLNHITGFDEGKKIWRLKE